MKYVLKRQIYGKRWIITTTIEKSNAILKIPCIFSSNSVAASAIYAIHFHVLFNSWLWIHINRISSFLFDIAQVLFNLQPTLTFIYNGIRCDTIQWVFPSSSSSFCLYILLRLSFNFSAIEYWWFDDCDMCVHTLAQHTIYLQIFFDKFSF